MRGPGEILQVGRQLLDPVLEAHGFTWVAGESGSSSGGAFASGEYVRGNRRLEIHFRYSLGQVAYHLDETRVEHAPYMRVLLGPGGGNQYPGFSNDPVDAFHHLAHDLGKYCAAFLSGSDREFGDIAGQVEADSKITGLKRLP